MDLPAAENNPSRAASDNLSTAPVKPTSHTFMTDPEKKGHWQFLANLLGAKPDESAESTPEADSSPAPSSPAAEQDSGESAPEPAPARPPRKKKSEKKKTPAPSGTGHWGGIASSLGLQTDAPVASDSPAPAAEVTEETSTSHGKSIGETRPAPTESFSAPAVKAPEPAPSVANDEPEIDPLANWGKRPQAQKKPEPLADLFSPSEDFAEPAEDRSSRRVVDDVDFVDDEFAVAEEKTPEPSEDRAPQSRSSSDDEDGGRRPRRRRGGRGRGRGRDRDDRDSHSQSERRETAESEPASEARRSEPNRDRDEPGGKPRRSRRRRSSRDRDDRPARPERAGTDDTLPAESEDREVRAERDSSDDGAAPSRRRRRRGRGGRNRDREPAAEVNELDISVDAEVLDPDEVELVDDAPRSRPSRSDGDQDREDGDRPRRRRRRGRGGRGRKSESAEQGEGRRGEREERPSRPASDFDGDLGSDIGGEIDDDDLDVELDRGIEADDDDDVDVKPRESRRRRGRGGRDRDQGRGRSRSADDSSDDVDDADRPAPPRRRVAVTTWQEVIDTVVDSNLAKRKNHRSGPPRGRGRGRSGGRGRS